MTTEKLSGAVLDESAVGTKHLIVNNFAGRGVKPDRAYFASQNINVYDTKSTGDCRDYVADVCRNDPNAWIIVCGGDGTISEAASGIIDAGASKTALLSVIATGSGNDFIRFMGGRLEDGVVSELDSLYIAGRYSINMVNIGFDCDVVAETERIRKNPLLKGAFSYILGVVTALVAKKTIVSEIVMEGVDGEDKNETLTGRFLLTAAAECPYCGGGFFAAPTASPYDGLVDLIIINNVTRRKFISLVGDYRNGTHFSESGEVADKVAGIITHKRCRAFKMNGLKQVCIDGEIVPADSVEARVAEKSIRYTNPKPEWIEATRR